jgi:SAM-dependent methyltransferase
VSRPAQIRFLSRVARLYDPVVALLGFRTLWRRMAEAAGPARGERALDVCAGTGGVARELTERGARVVGADLSAGMLRRARARGGLALVRMDARELAFGDRSFPLVTCCMALHEMSEPERERALAEIARVASGRVVVADYRVPRSRLGRVGFRALRAFEYLESDAFEPFVRRDFEQRLAGAGLRPIRSEDVGSYRIWICEAGACEPAGRAGSRTESDMISRTSSRTSAASKSGGPSGGAGGA